VWSEAKKKWCAENNSFGPSAATAAPRDDAAPFGSCLTYEVWSEEKKKWCAENANDFGNDSSDSTGEDPDGGNDTDNGDASEDTSNYAAAYAAICIGGLLVFLGLYVFYVKKTRSKKNEEPVTLITTSGHRNFQSSLGSKSHKGNFQSRSLHHSTTLRQPSRLSLIEPQLNRVNAHKLVTGSRRRKKIE